MIIGALVTRLAVAQIITLFSIWALTLHSMYHPEVFRFGIITLKFHDDLQTYYVSSLTANMIKNQLFGFIGVRISNAYFKGFLERQ
jgi:hypothetical protein